MISKFINKNDNPHKKIAFTLAEVLITLGIIGVVAALTLPTLNRKIQNQILVTKFKKEYATIQQGFKMMLVNENVDLLSQTSIFSSIGGTELRGGNGVKYRLCTIDVNGISNNCNNFIKNIGNYFKISTKPINYSRRWLNGNLQGNILSYQFLDSTTFSGFFYSNDPNITQNYIMEGMVGLIVIDVNGVKPPNIYGRDIFYLFIGDNAILYPRGTKKQSASESDCFFDENYCYWNGTAIWRNCKNDGLSSGVGCAARIIENNWKMDY